MDINKIEIGDIFTENSVYKCIGQNGNKVDFLHIQSGEEVTITTEYIKKHLVSGDQYSKLVETGLRNKYWTAGQVEDAIKKGHFKNELELPKEGQLRVEGLQTIFQNIPVGKVFTVVFTKKGTELSESQVLKKKKQLIADAVKRIETVQKAKKGVKEQAEKELELVLNTNISNYEPGEKRTLRGIKLERYSDTGFYNVKDLNYPDGYTKDNKRLVNINTLEEVIVDDVRYILEK